MAIRPYGNYGLSRITPVQAALSDTAQILGGGLREMGEAPLRASEAGLKRAKQEFELGKFERYQKPQLEAQKKFLESPATFGDYDKDEFMSVHFAQYLANPIANLYGAKWDTSGGMRKLVKPDGTPVTNMERQLMGNKEKNLVLSKMKVSSAIKDQLARYEKKLTDLQSMGALQAPEDSPVFAEYQRLETNIKKAQNLLKPGNIINLLERQKKVLQNLEGNYPEEIKRINGEIAAYKKQAAELAKEERIQARKIALEREKARLKTGDYKPTALMKNVPFVAKSLGVSTKTATEILTKSKNKSDDELISYFTGVFLREDSTLTGEELSDKIRTAMDTIRELRGEKPQETKTGVSTATKMIFNPETGGFAVKGKIK